MFLRDVIGCYNTLAESETNADGTPWPEWEKLPELDRKKLISVCQSARHLNPSADLIDVLFDHHRIRR